MEDYTALIAFWDNAKLPYKLKGRDSYDMIKRELKQKNTIFLVAELQGNLIGSVFGTHDGRKGRIPATGASFGFLPGILAEKLIG